MILRSLLLPIVPIDSGSQRTSGVIPLPNPAGAQITSDGEWLAVAAKGVAELCLWRTSIHTISLGVCIALLLGCAYSKVHLTLVHGLGQKARRRQLRLSLERLLSYPGMEVTCLSVVPGAVIAGTAHGQVVVHHLDKSGTNNAWSVIPLDSSPPLVKASVTGTPQPALPLSSVVLQIHAQSSNLSH